MDKPAAGDTHPEVRSGREEELRRRVETLQDELGKLKDELAKTNQGVLALVVELEERDEQLRRAHRRIFRELEDALRPPLPTVQGVDLAVYYASAEDDAPTGGDLYDVLRLPGGDLHIVVVDAAGHGVASTRAALTIIHAVRVLALAGEPPETLVERAATLLRPVYPDLVATLVVARFDPGSGAMRVASGGHPPPLLVPPYGDPHYVEILGRGIGYPDPGSDVIAEHRLTPGTLVLFYTDGLVEAMRNLNAGLDELADLGGRYRALPVDDLTDSIVRVMHRQVLHSDDTLLLAMRWTPPA
ncbi:serine phosphatase RsbU (regulator of sigma subunit) [Thermocatellispora tengchongensis]|uniref:Serine phosphatase RsbU (Regulator of sigma subunit) n=1 Tax=Thermocatellispora tengchongensis TaxID=1073253 RepID=A0A840PN14_9ACTN|nr:PP2C family protein-serine/threonine phosphatase [Thermocatellispora tengchongensis]MBB5139080.1 serine phosphatase RsbU (regulator of sigma subunit) [Thermocatellispora tengchongensis]